MKLKIAFLSLILFSKLFTGYTYAQEFNWAFSVGGSGWDSGNSIGIDDSGNIYLTGHFHNTADFDPSDEGTYYLNELAYLGSAFIMKTDSNQNFLWARGIYSTLYIEAFSLVNNQGSIYSGINFSGTMNIEVNDQLKTFSTSGDITKTNLVITKMNTSGEFIWVKSIEGTNISGNSISKDNDENIYVSGIFMGTAIFKDSVQNIVLNSIGIFDIFIAKYDADGKLIWVKQIGAENEQQFVKSLVVDNNNNLLLTGEFSGSVDFDPNFNQEILISNGYWDIFILKMDSDGNMMWVKQIGDKFTEFGVSITTDLSGNVYCSGEFTTNLDVDPGENEFILETDMTNKTYPASFILKLDPNGTFIWAKKFEIDMYQQKMKILSDDQGSIYTIGSFFGIFDFDPSDTGEFLLNSGMGIDVFISKLSTSGEFLWAGRMGNKSYTDVGNDLTLDQSHNLYYTGYNSNFADFNPSETDIYRIYSNGDGDNNAFVLKINQNSLDTPTFQDDDLKIFPNPFSDSINLEINDLYSNITVKITNLIGQELYVNFDYNKIDLSSLSKGVYLLTILNEDNVLTTRKIIKY